MNNLITLRNCYNEKTSVQLLGRVAPHTYQADCPDCENGTRIIYDEDNWPPKHRPIEKQCDTCNGHGIIDVPCSDIFPKECEDCLREEAEAEALEIDE
jgi:hypothetical protein